VILLSASTAGPQRCAGPSCSRPLEPAATGRPGRYCSAACRQAAHRGRIRQAEEAAARAAWLADANARARRARPMIGECRADAAEWLAEVAGSAADPQIGRPALVAALAELHHHVARLERAALAYKDATSDAAAAIAAHDVS
jgi:hypothetical protein